MLAWLSSGWRKSAAGLLVALYGLCAVVPVAAVAASDSSMAVHCLSEDPHAAQNNAPGGGAGHHHSVPGDLDQGAVAKCCGLFGVSALTPAFDAVIGHMARTSDVALPATDSLLGRGSDRIDRPPRFLQSL